MRKKSHKPITPDINQNRRTFFKSAWRLVVAAGLGTVSASLLLKEASGERCSYDFVCNRCRMQSTCLEPEAEAYRTSVRTRNQHQEKPTWTKSSKRDS
jgi:hypothetical protein